jgi:hypothetical protein
MATAALTHALPPALMQSVAFVIEKREISHSGSFIEVWSKSPPANLPAE